MRRFVALALAACSAPAPAPTHKPVPAPTEPRDEDLARLPDDAWAIGAIDLGQLRTSLARRWFWQIAGDDSALVAHCRDELAVGSRVTLALAGETDAVQYAIFHGVDRAAIARCATKVDVPERDLAPASTPCDGFDAAVHALTKCPPVPETQVPALVAVAAKLRSDGIAACPAAEKALAAVTARRAELGWECERGDGHHRREEHAASVGKPDAGGFAFEDSEHVDFLDDHTVLITVQDPHGRRDAAAAAKRVVPAAHARWFESTATRIDRGRGLWAIADVKKLAKSPAAIAITGGIHGDLALDVQITGAGMMPYEILGMGARLTEDKDFAGLKLGVGCAPAVTSPRSAKLGACEAALQHTATQNSTPNVDYSGLIAERVNRCAADNWPDEYVDCLGKAADEHASAACLNKLSESDRKRIEGLDSTGPCGDRSVAIHVAFPDGNIEALKLANATSRVERDCREPHDGEVSVAFADRPDYHAVASCVAGACAAFDVPTGHDAREGFDLPHAVCVGPLHVSPRGWSDAKGTCEQPFAETTAHPAIDQAKLPKDVTAISADGKRALAIAKGTASVFELPSGKALGKLALGKVCTTATFLGDLVAVDCGAKSYLASPAGQHLAELGDVVVAPLPLPDRTWALVARHGDRIDLYTGAGKKQTELAVPHRADIVGAATDGAGTIAIGYGGTGPDGGAIAVIDAKQQLRVFQQPICPALPAGH